MDHPVTKELHKFLRQRRLDAMERWASGGFTSESVEGTSQLNSAALGGMKVLDEIINLSYEDVQEGLYE